MCTYECLINILKTSFVWALVTLDYVNTRISNSCVCIQSTVATTTKVQSFKSL